MTFKTNPMLVLALRMLKEKRPSMLADDSVQLAFYAKALYAYANYFIRPNYSNVNTISDYMIDAVPNQSPPETTPYDVNDYGKINEELFDDEDDAETETTSHGKIVKARTTWDKLNRSCMTVYEKTTALLDAYEKATVLLDSDFDLSGRNDDFHGHQFAFDTYHFAIWLASL